MRENDRNIDYENDIANELMHISRRMVQRGARMMEDMNIGMGQAPILKLLGDNGTMTQRQIAEEIRVTPATICGTIKRMEKAGLIRRDSNAQDGRVTCISLTDEGRERNKQASRIIEMSHHELLSGFSQEECALLLDFARRMGDNLVKALEKAEEELK